MEFTLPDVAEGLADAEVVRWLVEEGAPVTLDEPFIEVETDKAVVDITAPVTGTLQRQAAAVGQVVKVGGLLAVFQAAGSARSAPNPEPAATPVSATAASPVTTTRSAPAGKPRATPSTRRLARELGIDLRDVTPSGDAGRILDSDVRSAADREPASDASPTDGVPDVTRPGHPPLPGRVTPVPDAADTGSPAWADGPVATVAETGEADREHVPLRGLRRATARTMTSSWATVPHVNSLHEVDFGALQSLRADLAAGGHAIPMTAFMVRAAALALRDFPVLNATVDADAEEMVLLGRRHIGVAIDAPDGLIVPVVADADRKSVSRIGAELRALSEAAATRSLRQEQLRGGTFTLNNYGPLGGWFGTSLVKPPEVGICSFGPIRDQVVPRDGEIVIRPVAVLALAADHRVADGHELIGFCTAVRRLLEEPLLLLVTD